MFMRVNAAMRGRVGVARTLRRLPLVDPFLPTVGTLLICFRLL